MAHHDRWVTDENGTRFEKGDLPIKNGIYKLTRNFGHEAGYGGLVAITNHKKGDLFYREPYECSKPGSSCWHPLSGGYPIADFDFPIYFEMELQYETTKPKEYYLNKVYTQHQVDKLLGNA